MAKLTKAQRAERRLKRAEAAEQVVESRVRTGAGFAVGYGVSQLLPRFIPGDIDSTVIDLGLMAAGGYYGFTDDSEFGDFMFGVGLVGTIQTLDKVVTNIEGWLDRNAPAAGG